MDRRRFLLTTITASATATGAGAWNAGEVMHLLPGASANRILIKASLRTPLAEPPRLALDGQRPVNGVRGDSRGYYWSFDIGGLEPGRRYTLHLTTARNKPLCDAWPLRTLPAMNDNAQRFRVAIYTCAGGHEKIHDGKGNGAFLSLDIRRRLLDRIASLEPDAVIAIGDHVYWDQRSIVGRPGDQDQQQIDLAGKFDRALPIFGTPNEAALLKATAPQIAELYGTVFRSTPVFFVQDDHDYFDNDEASDALVTLPPDAFMLRAGRATRRLFYPEFLPDDNRPNGLAGSYEFEPQQTLGECYGTLRWGRLAELLIYDCRRHLSLSGPSAGFVPATTEQWLLDRTKANDTAHLVHVPSIPFGWSAGKWGEWYSDVLDTTGKLTVQKPKPYWQVGWRAQHDRILQALADNRDRKPLLISGDLHSHALARIERSGKIDVSRNPVNVAIAGPISTSGTGWPSSARGTLAQSAIGLEMDTRIPVVEHNGFTIGDFTPGEVQWSFYGWNAGKQDVSTIDTLTPFHTETF